MHDGEMAIGEWVDGGSTYDEPRGECPKCHGPQVRHLIIGMYDPPDGPRTTPDWVNWVGCVHPGYNRECQTCGHHWTIDAGRPRGVLLELGQKVESKGRTLKVSQLDASALPMIREYLIGIARSQGTVTYGDVVQATGIPHLPRGLGRLMDLVSEDCFLTEEPSLAALVLNQTTGEVGDAFSGDAESEREYVYEYWAE